MPINDFKVLTIFSEILSFIFWYIFRITFIALIACHICLKFIFNHKEKCGFIWPKTFNFIFQKHSILIQKKEIFFENSCSWIFYFSQFNMFLACHFSKIYLHSEKKRGFIWPKTFDFLFQIYSNIHSEKKSCSLKIAVLEFQKYEKTTLKFSKIFEK